MSISSSMNIVINKHNLYSISDIINSLINNNWTIYDINHNINFLPINDNDNYDWQEKDITESELFDIIKYKQMKKETVGINLYYKGYFVGISLLFFSNKKISIMCDINRKKINYDDLIFVTDFNWYVESIIVPLNKNGFQLEYFSFEEY